MHRLKSMSKFSRKEWLYQRGFGSSSPCKFNSAWHYCAKKLNLEIEHDANGKFYLKQTPTYLGQPLSLMELVKKADGDTSIKTDIYNAQLIGINLAEASLCKKNVFFHDFIKFLEQENYQPHDTQENSRLIINFTKNNLFDNFPKTKNIVIPICPNWSTDTAGRYDFKTCFHGNSLVGKRAVKHIKRLNYHFKYMHQPVNFHVCIANYEGHDSYLQNKFKLSKKDFYERFDSTLREIKIELLLYNIHIKTHYITDLAESFNHWNNYLNSQKNITNKNSFKDLLKCSNKKIKCYLSEREALLRRIFKNQDIHQICKNQLAEYAAISHFIKKKFQQPLILGCDSISTAYGYHCIKAEVPLIYSPESCLNY